MKDLQGNENVMEHGLTAEDMYSTVTRADDRYTDAIDLSNACREYYQSRKRTADSVKEKLTTSGRQKSSKRNSLDVAMEKLRTEMSSLMDQDLSLMEQLLNLNEAIEDLKWQKNYYHSQSSVPASSSNLSESDWSVSETDMFESDNESSKKIPIQSSQSVHCRLNNSKELVKSDCCSEKFKSNSSCHVTPVLTNHMLASSPIDTPCSKALPEGFDYFLEDTMSMSRDDNSFDSGIHEPISRKVLKV